MYYRDTEQTLTMYSTPFMALIRALAPNILSVSLSLSLPIRGADTGQVCCQSLPVIVYHFTSSHAAVGTLGVADGRADVRHVRRTMPRSAPGAAAAARVHWSGGRCRRGRGRAGRGHVGRDSLEGQLLAPPHPDPGDRGIAEDR